MGGGLHIRLLSEQVANKIAAGEVVERPASVLKELMENAIDAGADRIDVDLLSGGLRLISVTDTGQGMSQDDALMSVQRHATSKIRDVDDIERIATMGFRGEALAAIASVSRFTLTTRSAESDEGTELNIAGGQILDVTTAGAPVGTSVRVRNLFFNVPARRKFLRGERTELAHVRQTFLLYALSHPEIALTLTVDGRQGYQLAGGATLEDRLRDIYGSSMMGSLRRVEGEVQGVRVHGYCGLPQLSRTDRADQYLFINHRPASAPVLSYALREVYRNLIPKDRHPVLFIFIDLDPAQVDINVHPTKKEVRFRRSDHVRDAFIEVLRRGLNADGRSAVLTGALPPPPEPSWHTRPLLQIEQLPPTRSFHYPRIPMVPESDRETRGANDEQVPVVSSTPADGTAPESATGGPWAWCRVLGQVGGLYVVIETEDGLVLMDPHAAHERVLFERWMDQLHAGTIHSQGLLTPETVALAPKDARLVERHLEVLSRMGFGISSFGGDTFIIDAVPSFLNTSATESLLNDLARTLEQGGSARDSLCEERVAKAACRAAVKARDRLTLEEIEHLVTDLASTRMPYTCPHGRPTLIYMGFGELRRKFGRE